LKVTCKNCQVEAIPTMDFKNVGGRPYAWVEYYTCPKCGEKDEIWGRFRKDVFDYKMEGWDERRKEKEISRGDGTQVC
jgi:hypothetical protein